MSEINLGQFIKNVFDYSTGKPVQQQPGKVANENFQRAQNEVMKTVQQTAQNIAQNFVRNQDILNTQMMLKELSNIERTMLLKQIFDFPESLTQLMEQVVAQGKNLTAKELSTLMTKELDISKLVVLMQTNGKVAMEKLAKMVTTMNQSGIYNTQQLKEMSILINACIPVADTPQIQVLKNLMIMYLPWLPLNESAGFSFGAEEESEGEKKNGDDSITIIITTKNFGIIKLLLFKEAEGFHLAINCAENFPKERFNAEIKGESSLHLESAPTYTTRKSENDEKSNELKVEFAQTTKITPQLLIIVHSIIRIITELDNIGTLEAKRKQEI